ncbi:MAG: helix-turn-helix domain-containing protein [Hahellaceae bacterium]|nr:helix-turn-helix domain-containing protein [Hahellaceae bacterium]
MKKEKATEAAQNTYPNYTDNSASSQRKRFSDAMEREQGKGVTTIQAVEELDIMRPSARICELRKMGLKILTIWTTSVNAQGKKHRNARYVLMSEGGAV